jgi:cytochrome c-type biogenesis protein CcmH/NrfG
MGMTEFLLVVAVGGGIIAVLFATFRGAAGDPETETSEAAAEHVDGDEALVGLAEQREAVLRSMEEIEADFEAGNLSEEDFRSLHARYQKQAAALGQRMGSASAGEPASGAPAAASAAQGSWVTSAIGWAAGGVAFAALAWLVMSQALSPRGPDGVMTGSIPGQGMGGSATGTTPIADVDMSQLAALEGVVASDSTNVEALVEVGHLYLTLQRYGETTQVTMKALELDPDNPEALTHLGMILMSVEHVADAIGAFDRALAIDPTFGEALQFKGMVSFVNQDFAGAVEAWERYIEVVPEGEQSPRVKAMLGMARASAAEQGQ